MLSMLVGGASAGGVPPKVHDHLHCFERVELQVKTAPDSQLLNVLSVRRLVTVLNEADKGS